MPDKPAPAAGVHVYVLPPEAVKVLLPPAHITVGLGVTDKVGLGLTVNVTVLMALVQVPTVAETV